MSSLVHTAAQGIVHQQNCPLVTTAVAVPHTALHKAVHLELPVEKEWTICNYLQLQIVYESRIDAV